MTLLALALAACRPEKAGSTDDSGPAVADLAVTVHPEIATVLRVGWTQLREASAARVEYRFEGGDWMASPDEPAAAGPVEVPLLGVPADTSVEIRLGQTVDGEALTLDEGWTATTGSLPKDLPIPTFVTYDDGAASPEGWMLYTVDPSLTYSGPFWVVIIDRRGRVVWYVSLKGSRAAVMSRVAVEGTYITWCEVNWYTGTASVLERTTLDRAWSESTELPGLGYTYDELPDGTIAYDVWSKLGFGIAMLPPGGEAELLWDCRDWLPEGRGVWSCGTNTVKWSEDRGTALFSLYDLDTVLEIDGATGELLHSWGRYGADDILPEGVGLQMQHYPNWTAEGTLLLTTQEVGDERVEWVREFTLDEETGAIEQVWSYSTSDYYADCSGEAVRLEGGNTLVNYGCDGGVRELSPGGEVVWEVDTGGLIGHQTLIGDLYAVNRGR